MREAQSALAAAEESVRFLEELYRVVENQAGRQAALRADALEVKARLASESHRALVLRNELLTRKESLNNLLGRDVGREFAVVEVPEPSPDEADLEAARAGPFERRGAESFVVRLQVDVGRPGPPSPPMSMR